jgi:hypothetical protein
MFDIRRQTDAAGATHRRHLGGFEHFVGTAELIWQARVAERLG